jgi:hypothetical protein
MSHEHHRKSLRQHRADLHGHGKNDTGTAMTAAAQHPVAGRAGGPDDRRPLTWQDVRGDTRRRADELVCT